MLNFRGSINYTVVSNLRSVKVGLMIEIVLKGIASGILLALLIGPVFFTIIQTSIERGFRSGFFVALGVSLSDTVYIFLSYLGLSQAFNNTTFQTVLTYGGGAMLLGFGGYYLFVKSKRMMNYSLTNIPPERSPFRLAAKGFIINGLSPMVLIFWIGTVGIATSELGYTNPSDAIVFFTSIIITVFTTDVCKAKLADKLRSLITPRLVRILNIVLGIVLIIFGCRLIFYADKLVIV
jgi:threonine/homoserine/homoserine lactone efflux protein